MKFSDSTARGYILGNLFASAIGLVLYTIMTALGTAANHAWGIVTFVMMGLTLYYAYNVFRHDFVERMICYAVLVGFVILTMFVYPMPPAVALAGVLLVGAFLGVYENQVHGIGDYMLGVVMYPAVALVAALQPSIGIWFALIGGLGLFTAQAGVALVLYAKERKEEAT